jgi:nucleoside-diphosphate-sugar epimerase
MTVCFMVETTCCHSSGTRILTLSEEILGIIKNLKNLLGVRMLSFTWRRTKNLIKACANEFQPILYGSTGSNYGVVTDVCTEETPLKPLSLYGETKTEAERLLLERGNSIAYRFATAFGISPRIRFDLLINDFANKCKKDGYLVVYEKHFMRTFIHVTDIANSFVFGIENIDKMIDNVYNVGSDSMNYSKEQVCNKIAEKTGAFVHFEEIGEDADKRNYVVSYDKINKLGFSTTVSMDEGIDEICSVLDVIDTQENYTNAKYY